MEEVKKWLNYFSKMKKENKMIDVYSNNSMDTVFANVYNNCKTLEESTGRYYNCEMDHQYVYDLQNGQTFFEMLDGVLNDVAIGLHISKIRSWLNIWKIKNIRKNEEKRNILWKKLKL